MPQVKVQVRCTGADSLPLSALTPLQGNLKSLSKDAFERLKKSILRSGFLFPFFVWKNGGANYYLDGHQRDHVLKALAKDKTVELPAKYPVAYIEAKDKQEAAEIILLQSSRYGRLSEESLADFFINNALNVDELMPILDLPDIEALDKPDIAAGLTDADDVPEAVEAITEPGDVWQFGDHRLMCGDCTDGRELGVLFGNEKARLLVTDPPYGVAYADKNKFLNSIARGNRIQEPIANDHNSPGEMSALWRGAFGAVLPYLDEGAAYYVTGPQGGDLLLLLLLALKESGYPLRHMLIWAKNNHVLGRADYNYKHEPIIYGWVNGSHKFYGGGGETSLWEIKKPQKSDLHPTMKPVEIYARAIANSSKPSDIVFDAFAGSGPMFIAAEQVGRRAYGMEIEPRYCDVIVKRWEQFTGKKAERLHAVAA